MTASILKQEPNTQMFKRNANLIGQNKTIGLNCQGNCHENILPGTSRPDITVKVDWA